MQVLEGVFNKSPAEAFRIMMKVHTEGRGLCGLYHVRHRRDQGVRGSRPRAAVRVPAAREHGRGVGVFSASVELLLSVAFREATARRHTHLTLEHLLYVLAHDGEGERILAACGADLPKLRIELDKYLQKNVEQFPRGQQKEPDQTLSFRRVLQTAVLHVQSSGKGEVEAGDLLAALLQQSRAFAAQLLEAQGVTRLDVLNYVSHGISKVPHPPASERGARRGPRRERLGRGRAGDRARSARRVHDEPQRQGRARPARSADRPDDRVAAHARDPLPAAQEQPGVRRRSRRRQDGDGRRPGDAAARRRRAAVARRAPRCTRWTPRRCSRARGSAATSRSGSRPSSRRSRKRQKPILFIDEIHSTVGAGATTGGTLDLATLIKPVLTAGELRVVGSTTFEEFKHIEKDRALARRLQKVIIEEPTTEETVKILEGLRSRYEDHHLVTLLDRGARRGGQAGQAPPARVEAARQRHRHPGRGRRDGPARRIHASGTVPPRRLPRHRRPGACDRGCGRDRASHAPPRSVGLAGRRARPTRRRRPAFRWASRRSSVSSRGWRASRRSRPTHRTAIDSRRSRSRCGASSSGRTRPCTR